MTEPYSNIVVAPKARGLLVNLIDGRNDLTDAECAAVDEVYALLSAMDVIATSAMDDSQNGNDTAEVVYQQLTRFGIVVP